MIDIEMSWLMLKEFIKNNLYRKVGRYEGQETNYHRFITYAYGKKGAGSILCIRVPFLKVQKEIVNYLTFNKEVHECQYNMAWFMYKGKTSYLGTWRPNKDLTR